MPTDEARVLLNQAEIVEGIATALVKLGELLKGRTHYTEADREATRQFFNSVAVHQKLLRQLLNESSCNPYMRDKIAMMLHRAADDSGDRGVLCSEVWEYSGITPMGVFDPVQGELLRWVKTLRAEAANAPGVLRPEVVGKRHGKPKRKGKLGKKRLSESNPERCRQYGTWYREWKTGKHKTYADCAGAFGGSVKAVDIEKAVNYIAKAIKRGDKPPR